MRSVVHWGLAVLPLIATGACGTGEIGGGSREATTEGDTSSLVIDAHTDARTSGRLHTSSGDLIFAADGALADHVSLSITLNGRSIVAALDGESTIFDGHGAVLDASDRSLLASFIDGFAVQMNDGDAFAARDASLQGLAMYVAIAPEGYALDALATGGESTASPLALTRPVDAGVADSGTDAAAGARKPFVGDEGVTCIRKNTTVVAVYAGRDGVAIQEAIVVGSNRPNNYGCMGRCGAGCGGFGSGWTKDCLDHDACSYKFKSTGGSSDINCGDEYRWASDDFLRSGSCNGS